MGQAIRPFIQFTIGQRLPCLSDRNRFGCPLGLRFDLSVEARVRLPAGSEDCPHANTVLVAQPRT